MPAVYTAPLRDGEVVCINPTCSPGLRRILRGRTSERRRHDRPHGVPALLRSAHQFLWSQSATGVLRLCRMMASMPDLGGELHVHVAALFLLCRSITGRVGCARRYAGRRRGLLLDIREGPSGDQGPRLDGHLSNGTSGDAFIATPGGRRLPDLRTWNNSAHPAIHSQASRSGCMPQGARSTPQ